MSHSGKRISELGLDTLTDRLRDSLTCDNNNTNKPDFRELDLGSPVSPLRTRQTSGPATSSLTTTTTTSSSSSSSGSVSGRNGLNLVPRRSDSGSNSHSGELSVESSPTSASRAFKPGHRSSDSGSSHPNPNQNPLIYSGATSLNSPPLNVLPTGNICPSGKILKTGMAGRSSKTDVLGSGTGNYGHGSVMRGGSALKSEAGSGGAVNVRSMDSARRAMGSLDPEEVKRAGNEQYRVGNLAEALGFVRPGDCDFSGKRHVPFQQGGGTGGSAAVGGGNPVIVEDLLSCGVWSLCAIFSLLLFVISLSLFFGLFDCSYFLTCHSLGQVENARRHFCLPGYQVDGNELQKLQAVEMHLSKCTDARKIADWRTALREADAAIVAGVDASPQLYSCKVEALLKLHQLEDANSSLSNVPKFEPSAPSCSQSKIFGMLSEAYLFFVQAQIEMAFGRFENAVTVAEKAGQIDPRNVEISVLLNNVRLVSRARARGNDLFKSERFTEASSAYGEGLRLDPLNAILLCNRAACWYKLGLWERSVDDCNQALLIQPNYTKALLRRAASNSKLERWTESVRDYEVLRRELPNDNEVAESLFHAQVALKKSRGEDVSNMKFGGEVELVSDLEQFKAAISSPGASVVHFKSASNLRCKQISPFLDILCGRYPSINFLKVDVEESRAIAIAENVRILPTFKIYKNGSRVKEMVCPSPEVLESSVRHYSF
ncbi:tetratricopetide-repeat thioredoxin-like 1 [Actinidia rufa]|uniref:Tetratricopetide-repeat thioredoxin-like 1 n=1 Tax=Actinidia rufa TaxID=165716 RepID=A0A7J0GNQ4_9ERIC|nr:tetratricopetide-repeat thioredoxin-like 1 [Actinidia rufa]